MDQAQILTLLGLAMNAVVMVFMMLGYFRRFATKDDIKDLSDRLVNVENGLGNVETRMGQIETRQDGLETRFDNLEAYVRENGRKADASLDLHHTVRGDLKVLQASVNRLESYFETPKLKSS